ncbi:hypothetical protein F383_29139 [Gossypium arboreum]|uniref:Uncharacterized protein n=1 Tax=Gossypium arboreum TaxID=29729 RepID=A0A0B0PDF4_GOSAR|nr:hypothetical protein F383_29139 [Gossypium arboreum]
MAKPFPTRATHTPMCQPMLISNPVSLIHRKSQFLGFLSFLKSINTH